LIKSRRLIAVKRVESAEVELVIADPIVFKVNWKFLC
jgi:hypothetical protein